MKPTNLVSGRFLLLIGAIGITIGLVSWDYQHSPGYFKQPSIDTVPKKSIDREKKIRDLDDVINEMNEADMKIDAAKIKQEIAEAMKDIDGEKLKMQIEQAMNQVDMAKIQQEVELALAKVDFTKIKAEVANAMKEIDAAKIQEEVEASLAKIDWEKMKAELEKVKEIDMSKFDADMKKMEADLNKIGPQVEKEMKKAREELEKAKAEMKEYKSFVEGLENDGLISKEKYKIKHKDGVLEINGGKATDKIYNKYIQFLKNHKKFTIKKDEDNFNINID